MSFPNDFNWGAAASSYQIEGGWKSEGKGLSVWDQLSHTPGKIWQGHNGDRACDHYHRFKEDVALMSSIGLRAYRLSISWPRVLPDGIGELNKSGIGFYDRLVDELLAHHIEPWITLFHWDYPYELFKRGGWLNPDSPKWFAEFTEHVVDFLSDRVSHWMTLNEPQCFIGLGHDHGEHAPGLKLSFPDVLQAGHHALLAHGLAVQTIRAQAKLQPIIGWAPVGMAYCPATDDPADIAVAWKEMGAVYPQNIWCNAWWGDPPILGHYPEEGLRLFGPSAPKVKPGDLETICQPLDFYGCNIYSGKILRAGPDGRTEVVTLAPGHPHTHFNWSIVPEVLYWGPKFLAERYKLPIVITENGLSCADWVSLDGKVHDTQRIDYLHRHLLALHRAVEEGVDVRGYFHWSIMDNFEWAEGYKQRFGLIHVDFETLERQLKDSAYWYREVIESNGESLLP